MAHRTSMQEIEGAVAHMNNLTGATPYTEGAYHLQANIGGYAVSQRNKSSGYREIFGFDRAAVIRAQIYAWCNGFEEGKKAT